MYAIHQEPTDKGTRPYTHFTGTLDDAIAWLADYTERFSTIDGIEVTLTDPTHAEFAANGTHCSNLWITNTETGETVEAPKKEEPTTEQVAIAEIPNGFMGRHINGRTRAASAYQFGKNARGDSWFVEFKSLDHMDGEGWKKEHADFGGIWVKTIPANNESDAHQLAYDFAAFID